MLVRGYGYGPMMGGGGHIFGGFFAFLFGITLIVGIVLLVVWAVRASSQRHHPQTVVATGPQAVGPVGTVAPPIAPRAADEALAIARKRFASGEITKEQYEEIAQTLGS